MSWKNKVALFCLIVVGAYFSEAIFCYGSVRSASALAAPTKRVKPQIWVFNPWIKQIVTFIGGDEIAVHALLDWEGTLISSDQQSIPPGNPIIVLDKEEAGKIPVAYELQNIWALFENMPILWGTNNPMYLDPPTMSLLGEKILITLSSLFPEKYMYFQRNLAELESRLESTVDMGRQMLRPVKITNLSKSYAFWIRAASFKEVSMVREIPDCSLDISEKTIPFFEKLDRYSQGGYIIVTDRHMPLQVQDMVEGEKNGVVLSLPALSGDQEDFFLFLYEQYLAILNRYNQFEKSRIQK